MEKGNGFYYINLSCMMKGRTCKVGQGERKSGLTSPSLCCARLSTFSMKGCKYENVVSLGLSVGVHWAFGEKRAVNSERLINQCICHSALHPFLYIATPVSREVRALDAVSPRSLDGSFQMSY